MTENQRDYLADLAARKGVKLRNTGNVSAAWASKKIEELKAMPDAEFDEMSKAESLELAKIILKVGNELSKWNFTK